MGTSGSVIQTGYLDPDSLVTLMWERAGHPDSSLINCLSDVLQQSILGGWHFLRCPTPMTEEFCPRLDNGAWRTGLVRQDYSQSVSQSVRLLELPCSIIYFLEWISGKGSKYFSGFIIGLPGPPIWLLSLPIERCCITPWIGMEYQQCLRPSLPRLLHITFTLLFAHAKSHPDVSQRLNHK